MKNDLFDYFTTDNISGKKCTEKWLSKNNYDLYKEIINWCDKFNTLKEIEFKRKVYHYIFETIHIPTCPTCGCELKYNRIKDGYQKYCSDKCVKSSNEYYQKWLSSINKNNKIKSNTKRKETIINRYGSLENFYDKLMINRKNSILKKYGVEYNFQTEEFKNKRKKILKEKYGNEKFNNPNKTKNTRINNGTQISDDKTDNFNYYKRLTINRTYTIYRNNKQISGENKSYFT